MHFGTDLDILGSSGVRAGGFNCVIQKTSTPEVSEFEPWHK